MNRGEAVLFHLVKGGGWMTGRELALCLGLKDGRSVAHTLRQLEAAKLIDATRGNSGCWWPTKRGHEVNRILDEITVARGGRFRPKSHAGLSISEMLALR